jgi:hypothetical protein
MSQYVINTGALPNDGTGDPLRTAFNDVNLNFDQVFAAGPVLSNIQIANNTILTTNTNGNLILAPNGVGVVQSNVSIVPNVTRIRNLGSPNALWLNTYTQYLNTAYANIGTANITNIGTLTIDVANLHISGGSNGYVLQTDGTGNLTWTAQTGGSGNGVPGGANSQVQFNDAGVFGGAPGFTFNKTSNTLFATTLFAKTGSFTGNPGSGIDALYVGTESFVTLGSAVMAQITGNVQNYSQVNFQNSNDSRLASGDYIITADNGNDTTHFLDLGMTSSNWDGRQENSLGTSVGPNNGYLYVQDGNLTLGTKTGNTAYVWTFGTDGSLSLPAGNIIGAGNITGPGNISYPFGPGVVVLANIDAPGNSYFTLQAVANNSGILGYMGVASFGSNSLVGLIETADGQGNYYDWTFQPDGRTSFPNYTFPNVDGTAGQVLATYGNSEIYWANVAPTNWDNIGNITGGYGPDSIAIGAYAANSNNGGQTISIGFGSGQDNQGRYGVAVGYAAGGDTQGRNAVAIGTTAGRITQGNNSIAIGAFAGSTNQANNTIIFNASDSEINGVAGQENSFYVNPVRNDTGNTTNALYYNTSTKEISYGPAGGSNILNGTSNVSIPVANGNVYINANASSDQQWAFATDGSFVPPTQPSNQRTGSGLVLKLGDTNTQAIITGPAPVANVFNTAPRLVVAGQDGLNYGEGGDIYLWAGRSGPDGGSGGDIKVDGGDGYNGSEGGTVKIRGGYGYGGTAGQAIGGFVEIYAGGGNIGAPVDIRAGQGNSQPNSGNITLTTYYGGTWTFGNDGEFYLPTGGRIGATKGGTMLDGGAGNSTSLTSFYANSNYSGCFTAYPNGNVAVTTYGDGTGLGGTWNFDANANLTLASTNANVTTGSGEAATLRGTRKIVNGYQSSYAYSTVLAAGGTPTVAYTATNSDVLSTKVTFAVEGSGYNFWEQFDVSAVKNLDSPGNVNFTVSNRVKSTTAIADTAVTATIDGSGRIAISLNLDPLQGAGWSSFDAVEFVLMAG